MGKTGAIRAGKAYVALGTDNAELQKGLESAQKRLRQFGATIRASGAWLAAAGGGILAPLTMAVKGFVESGDALAKMSARTGVAVEQLSQLKYAAEQSGLEMGSLENAIRRMQQNLQGADEEAKQSVQAFDRLGLSIDDLRGQGTHEQFLKIAESLSQVPDPSQRAAYAMRLFGRAGTELLPMLANGRTGIEEFMKTADKMGLTVTTAQAKLAEELGDRISDLKKTFSAITFQIGAALAPAVLRLAANVQVYLSGAIGWITSNKELIITLAVLVGKVGLAATGLGGLAMVIGQTSIAASGLLRALSFVVAHPAYGLIALAGAFASAIVVANQFRGSIVALAGAQKGLLDNADRQRTEDLGRIERLKVLAAQTKLNNSEMTEAKQLIAVLNSHFAGLGLTIDETTGTINGMTTAMAELNKAIRERAILDIDRALAEAQGNLKKLQDQLKTVELAPSAPDTFTSGLLEGIGLIKSQEELRAENKALREKLENAMRETLLDIKILRLRREAAEKGLPEGIAPGAPPVEEKGKQAVEMGLGNLLGGLSALKDAFTGGASIIADAASDLVVDAAKESYAAAKEAIEQLQLEPIEVGGLDVGQIREQIGAAGTFNVERTIGLQSGGPVQQRLDELIKIERHILDAVKEGGVHFT